jgi:lipoprotein-anchoring transpeptidase ErfK/SrfK
MRQHLSKPGVRLLLCLFVCGAQIDAARAQQQQQQTSAPLTPVMDTTKAPASPVRPGPGHIERLDEYNDSAWSDKYTGGHVEQAELIENDPNIEITVDVPAFRLTLWQDGKEVKSYHIGVGQKQYPLVIGTRKAEQVIWNPPWIPPDSDWVSGHKGVNPGDIIKAGDPRNPIGKVKIPLGDAYLIHQAHGPGDLGNLVSHGCVRMLQSDLLDLAAKINAAYGWPVSAKQIERALNSKRTLYAALETPLTVDINYETIVVEGGALHLYPDVYERGTSTLAHLRTELAANGVEADALDTRTLKGLLARVRPHNEYVVSLDSIKAGQALTAGEYRPLTARPVNTPPKRKPSNTPVASHW